MASTWPPNLFLNSDVSGKGSLVRCEAVVEPEQCDELCYVDADAERLTAIWHTHRTVAQWFPFSCVNRNCCSWRSFGTWIDFMASWMRKMHNFRLDLYCRTYSKQDLLSRAWLQVGSTGRSRSDWRPRRCQGEVADPSVFQFDDFSSHCFGFLGFTFMIST